MNRPPALLVILLTAAACTAADENTPSRATSRDSAGVVLVSNPDATVEWRLDEAPVVSIGSIAGPPHTQFTRIVSALRLSDGRIVAANFNTPPEVRFYSATGEHLRSVGRAGEGPGEYSSIAWVKAADGGLLVYDWWTSRFTLLSDSGDVAAVTPIAEIAGLPPTRFTLRDMFADGSFLARPNFAVSPGTTGEGRFPTPVLHVSADLSTVDTLLVVPGVMYSTPDSIAQPVLFGADVVLRAAGDRLIVGTAEDFRFDVRDPNGRLTMRVSWEQEQREVTDADVHALLESRLSQTTDPAMHARIRRYHRAADVASHMPPYDRIVAGDDGTIWVRSYSPGGEPSTWRVFSRDGILLARVQMPPQLRIEQAGDDWVLGVWRNELDVESVRLYRVQQ